MDPRPEGAPPKLSNVDAAASSLVGFSLEALREPTNHTLDGRSYPGGVLRGRERRDPTGGRDLSGSSKRFTERGCRHPPGGQHHAT